MQKMTLQNECRKRLLSGHDFWITCTDDDGVRFIRHFRSAWRKIPLSGRRCILKYWSSVRETIEHAPFFQLSNFIPKDVYACVGSRSREVKFNQSRFTHLPRMLSEGIIAHELAHVVQHATDTHASFFEPMCDGSMAHDECVKNLENDANRIAGEWGFELNRTLLSIYDIQLKNGSDPHEACQFVMSLFGINFEQECPPQGHGKGSLLDLKNG